MSKTLQNEWEQIKHLKPESSWERINIDKLFSRIDTLEQTLRKLSVGSCTCMTKTPAYTHHALDCKYYIIQDTLNSR